MKSCTLHAVLSLILVLSFGGCGNRGWDVGGGSHTLANGMEVMLVENHSSPVISAVVCVRAGSAYEDGMNNGVSHLLEHLLFDGTGERTRREIAESIEGRGGYLNATTRDDHTAFILLIPSEHVEEGLEVLADMLFNSVFPDSEVVKERRVVIEEINKDDDDPSYLAEKFHRSHLYSGIAFARPVIGFRNVIASISRDEIIRYYRDRYVTGNMITIITGDFQAEKMLATLERIFGTMPPGEGSGLPNNIPLPRRSNKVFQQDLGTSVSRVKLSFDVPSPNEADYYPLDYFVRLMSYHDGAPLVSALKGGEDPVAFSVSTDLSPHAFFATFTVSATTRPGKEDEVIRMILDLLEEKSSREPEAVEMRGVMVAIKSEEYLLSERYHYYGLTKAPYLVSAGFDFLDNYISRMEEVTPAMVRKVAEKFFTKPRYMATIVGPATSVETPPVRSRGEGEVRRVRLDNGLRLIIREEKGSEIFAVHVVAGNRAYLEPEGKSGLADFLSRMLLRGTETRKHEQLAGDLARIGANIMVVDDPNIPYDDYYTTKQYSFIRFETLEEYWREGLNVLSDVIQNPALGTDEIENVRKELLSLIAGRQESTYKTARRLFYKTLFSGHPFSHSILGEKEDVERIGAADLRWMHGVQYSPNNLVISVVSGVSPDSVEKSFSALFSGMEPVELPAGFPRLPEGTRYLKGAEERMEKEQAYIYMGDLLPGIESDDVSAVRAMIAILSERLALELREKEGLAYSVGASAHFAGGFGWYSITMGTERGNYQRAVDGIRREIGRLRSETPGDDELRKAVDRTIGRELMRRLSSINRARLLGHYEFLLGDYRESETELERMKGVTAEDVRRMAREYLRADRGVLSAVR